MHDPAAPLLSSIHAFCRSHLFTLHYPNMLVDPSPLLELSQAQVFRAADPAQAILFHSQSINTTAKRFPHFRSTATVESLCHVPFRARIKERDGLAPPQSFFGGIETPSGRVISSEVQRRGRLTRVIHFSQKISQDEGRLGTQLLNRRSELSSRWSRGPIPNWTDEYAFSGAREMLVSRVIRVSGAISSSSCKST